ncbi:MAG TPA: lipoyl synthase [Desulfobacteraceae bacterium]|nr:lipoyl synthase [Deltaproteobacteria bacterium]RLB99117.1 MAG: lipoyl synthase [Deltaproteobacteria bacterium]HDI59322.1 lipoyl synthase [Desulfobacteraceae bacterium]
MHPKPPASTADRRAPKPAWLRKRLPSGPAYESVRRLLGKAGLHTVCQSARCPNQFECFTRHTATFMILGDHCTRDCRFCAVSHGPPEPVDPDEPRRVAEAAAHLGLRYVVVTSVTRDDLPDGGADLFAAVIHALRQRIPGVRVEVLIPDFQGRRRALETVLAAGPVVLNHNLETVARLYPAARPQADYRRSLDLLARSRRAAPRILTKSGLMLGLGESEAEIRTALADLRAAGVQVLTLGQYLQPTAAHLPVARYLTPETFESWRREALAMGFAAVASGPFVRSSYRAEALCDDARSA